MAAVVAGENADDRRAEVKPSQDAKLGSAARVCQVELPVQLQLAAEPDRVRSRRHADQPREPDHIDRARERAIDV
jgi:hypothetical protein